MPRRPCIRKRPVSFGNPALGTYHGFVHTIASVDAADWHDRNDSASCLTDNANSNNNNFDRPVVEDATQVYNLVAMIGVPPNQVPEGILNLAAPYAPHHVRIVICEPFKEGTTNNEHKDGDERENEESIEQGLDDDDDENGRSYLVLLEFATSEDANMFIEDWNGQPYTHLDTSETCTLEHILAVQGHGGVQLQMPFLSGASATHDATAKQPEDYNCAVCLERMDYLVETGRDTERSSSTLCAVGNPSCSILTTVCNHSFHMDCLLKWQDSPCPVCRYDHSGLNEALSQCHICSTTVHNYVCLICGVVSCGVPVAASAAPSSDTAWRRSECQSDDDANSNLSSDPPAAQPLSHNSHARAHYDKTFHAYALNTETQHVWDFAGQGYVHRLLQNKQDGKLVEGTDPHTSSHERSRSPGLSSEEARQEEHRKLEGLASQYYALLKSQLEQQRIFYEGRLSEVRREFEHENTNSASGGTCSTDLIRALKCERQQLQQRLGRMEELHKKTTGDVDFLQNLVDSLEKNRASLQVTITEAQRRRVETRTMFQQCLPALQEQVTKLMLQLENCAASTAELESTATSERNISNPPQPEDKKPAAR